jgi:hypothetical protein
LLLPCGSCPARRFWTLAPHQRTSNLTLNALQFDALRRRQHAPNSTLLRRGRRNFTQCGTGVLDCSPGGDIMRIVRQRQAGIRQRHGDILRD